MAITEQSRYELYQSLEEIMGKERATTLMEHLPPVGWADVATKSDLQLLQMTLTAELHRGLYRQVGFIAGMLGLLFTALKLT